MEYDLYREPPKNLVQNNKEIPQTQVTSFAGGIGGGNSNQDYNESDLEFVPSTHSIEIYHIEGREGKYIDLDLAKSVGINELINPITILTEKDGPFYKVTDKIIEKIIEYCEKKDKVKVGIVYREISDKKNKIANFSNIDLETNLNKKR